MTETILQNKTANKIGKLKKWKVTILNDDKTSMEFVVAILMRLFNHTNEIALQLTLAIHNNGSADVGIYSYEIAETKKNKVIELAKLNGFPLQARISPE